MFCSKCGAEILYEAVICPKCGCETKKEKLQVVVPAEVDEPKTGIGVLLGLFLGIIGLIIGLCLFKENTIARKTFLKSWGITFGVCVAVYIVLLIIYMVGINSMINDIYDSYPTY